MPWASSWSLEMKRIQLAIIPEWWLSLVLFGTVLWPAGMVGQGGPIRRPGMAGSTVARRRHSRIVVQLDRGWRLLSLPGFRRWPAEAQLTSAQLQALHCPWPRGRWRRVHLPDDYIVRGGIAPHANPALRLAARLCAPGGRECLISSPAPARMNTRLKRSAFGGHGY